MLGCTGVAPQTPRVFVQRGGMDRASVIAVLVFAALIVGIGACVFTKFLPSGPPPTPPWEQRAKEIQERHDQALHDLVEASANTIDLDARGLPAGEAFNRALELYDEVFRSQGKAPTELVRRLEEITGDAAHPRIDALMKELQLGSKRPVPQLHPDESAELEKRRRRAETEKTIRDAEGALPR